MKKSAKGSTVGMVKDPPSIHITREEYAAMTRKDRKRYYWHDGRLCLKKIYRVKHPMVVDEATSEKKA